MYCTYTTLHTTVPNPKEAWDPWHVVKDQTRPRPNTPPQNRLCNEQPSKGGLPRRRRNTRKHQRTNPSIIVVSSLVSRLSCMEYIQYIILRGRGTVRIHTVGAVRARQAYLP
jgi:hypothetical protein